MSFYEIINQYKGFDFDGFFTQVSDQDVLHAIDKAERESLSPQDLLTLLSPRAAQHMEAMAQKAHRLTVQHFGKTIQLFIPLYISNYCTNRCTYCGFNHDNTILRERLDLQQVEAEAKAIASTGMQHVLVLTGEDKRATPMSYLREVFTCLKKYFASVAIEMFPMDEDAYRELREIGVDGLTLFQETYDEEVYKEVHPGGMKANYRYRLDGPERGARAGFRVVNLGSLIGLANIRSEAFFTAMHGRYIDNKYLDTEVAFSFPRINPAEGEFVQEHFADDRTFVQFLLAYRLFLPRAGITISTRERSELRDHLIELGATRFSAGVCTGVGGYAELAPSTDPLAADREPEHTPQFEITDERSVQEMEAAILAKGYQPVYKDWDNI